VLVINAGGPHYSAIIISEFQTVSLMQ